MPEMLLRLMQAGERLEMLDEALALAAERTGNFREEHYSRCFLRDETKRLGLAMNRMNTLPDDISPHEFLAEIEASMKTLAMQYQTQIDRLEKL